PSLPWGSRSGAYRLGTWLWMVVSGQSSVVRGTLATAGGHGPPTLRDVGEDLAADAGAAGLLVGHHALARRDDGDAEAVHHAGQLAGADVAAEAGLRDALEPLDHGPAAALVLEVDAEEALLPVVHVEVV